MRYCVKIIAILLSVLLLCGCWSRRELDTIAIVIGLGIDNADKEGEVALTVEIEKPAPPQGGGSGGSGGGSGAQYLNITNKGSDIFTIVRDYNSEIGRKLYFPHNQVVIFGEEFAKLGIRNQIDFLLRDHENRLNVQVLVAKGKAQEIMNSPELLEGAPAVDIMNMIESQKNTSEAPDIDLLNLLSALTSATTSPIAPLVSLEKEGEESKIIVAGTAVFKGDRLVGEFNGAETRGMLWMMDKMGSGALNFKHDDGTVSLEIVKTKTKVKVGFKPDGSPIVKVEVKPNCNLGSQSGIIDQTSEESLKALEKRADEIIKAEMEYTLTKAKSLGTDVYGFGSKFHQHYPKKWKEMELKWDDLFKALEVEVTVKTSIQGVGRMTKPAYPDMTPPEDKK